MGREPEPDFFAILRVLTRFGVDFVVVGGVCAVLHGAPLTTFDLDLVHSRSPDNVRRLLEALTSLDARYRQAPLRRRRPDSSHLSSPGHQLLMTRYGPLDLLGMIGKGRTYDELAKQSTEVRLGGRLRVKVLNLEPLIRIKEETAGEKDRAVLALLRRCLEEKSRKGT